MAVSTGYGSLRNESLEDARLRLGAICLDDGKLTFRNLPLELVDVEKLWGKPEDYDVYLNRVRPTISGGVLVLGKLYEVGDRYYALFVNKDNSAYGRVSLCLSLAEVRIVPVTYQGNDVFYSVAWNLPVGEEVIHSFSHGGCVGLFQSIDECKSIVNGVISKFVQTRSYTSSNIVPRFDWKNSWLYGFSLGNEWYLLSVKDDEDSVEMVFFQEKLQLRETPQGVWYRVNYMKDSKECSLVSGDVASRGEEAIRLARMLIENNFYKGTKPEGYQEPNKKWDRSRVLVDRVYEKEMNIFNAADALKGLSGEEFRRGLREFLFVDAVSVVFRIPLEVLDRVEEWASDEDQISVYQKLKEHCAEAGFVGHGKGYDVGDIHCVVSVLDSDWNEVYEGYRGAKLELSYFYPEAICSATGKPVFYTANCNFYGELDPNILLPAKSMPTVGTNKVNTGNKKLPVKGLKWGLFPSKEKCIEAIKGLSPYYSKTGDTTRRLFFTAYSNGFYKGVKLYKTWYLRNFYDDKDDVYFKIYNRWERLGNKEYDVKYNKPFERINIIFGGQRNKDLIVRIVKSLLSSKVIHEACLSEVGYDYRLSVWDRDMTNEKTEFSTVDGFSEDDVIRKGKKYMEIPKGCVYVLDKFTKNGTISSVNVYDKNWKLIKKLRKR